MQNKSVDYNCIEKIRRSFSKGMRVKIIYKEPDKAKRIVEGWIYGVYPQFIVVTNGKYRQCFCYSEIVTGKAKVKRVR